LRNVFQDVNKIEDEEEGKNDGEDDNNNKQIKRTVRNQSEDNLSRHRMHNQKLNIDVMTLLNKPNEKQNRYLSIFINDEKNKKAERDDEEKSFIDTRKRLTSSSSSLLLSKRNKSKTI
jgi:hypothetical protein